MGFEPRTWSLRQGYWVADDAASHAGCRVLTQVRIFRATGYGGHKWSGAEPPLSPAPRPSLRNQFSVRACGQWPAALSQCSSPCLPGWGQGDWIRGGGGLPGDNFDGDNFGGGKFAGIVPTMDYTQDVVALGKTRAGGHISSFCRYHPPHSHAQAFIVFALAGAAQSP